MPRFLRCFYICYWRFAKENRELRRERVQAFHGTMAKIGSGGGVGASAAPHTTWMLPQDVEWAAVPELTT